MQMDIRENISLREYTWFKTGGAARWFCTPSCPDDYVEAVQFAHAHDAPLCVLGEGANVLVNEDGVDALVIHPINTDISVEPCEDDTRCLRVHAGAGAKVQDVIDAALDAGATGLEVFSGIPGTIGGAVFINIHYFDAFLADFFTRAHVCTFADGRIHSFPKDWFDFGYDLSTLHQGNDILIDAEFTLSRANDEEIAYARGRRDEIIRHRERRYPTERTCGSFFQNFTNENNLHQCEGREIRSVAWYLDRLGVKGTLRENGAHVSVRHANMIVTDDSATSRDVVRLARKLQKMMMDEFGLMPHAECQFIGFNEHPLRDKNPI